MSRNWVVFWAMCLLLAGVCGMGLFKWLSGGKSRGMTRTSKPSSWPWTQHPSVYEHVKAHLKPNRQGLAEAGDKLPDDERIAAGSRVRWISGGKDGVWSFHGGGRSSEDQAESLLSLIRLYCGSPTPENKLKVYEEIVKGRAIDLVDPLLESLVKASDLNRDRLYDLAISFAAGAPDREPVKLGVAILGLYRDRHNDALFLTLGQHEEFTLYCAVALGNTANEADNLLWELAKSVHGWGRIHVVVRLANTQNPKIRDWLLREGYQNSVMNEYLAFTCAQTGGLASALAGNSIDDGLLCSAGDIIVALLTGGPAKDINDYDDGALAVERYLQHLAPKATTIHQFLVVSTIKDWLSAKDAAWKAREAKNWTPQRRTELLRQCSEIMAHPAWRESVLAGLKSEDEQVFFEADRAASLVGIDTWSYRWGRLCKAPAISGRWFHVMNAANNERIGQIVALAENSLPLDKIATGPGEEMGFGKAFESHGCLDYVVQGLDRFPAQGMSLIRTALRSPVIRNRNMALKALAGWGRSKWPQDVEPMVKKALADEPDADVQKRMRNLLEGKPLEEKPSTR